MQNVTVQRSMLADLAVFLHDVRYIILFFVLGDFFTTQYALNYGIEENGFLRIVMAEYGIWSLFVLKLFFLVIVYYNYKLLKHEGHEWLKLWDISKMLIGFAGLFLVVNNLMVILFGYSSIQLIESILF